MNTRRKLSNILALVMAVFLAGELWGADADRDPSPAASFEQANKLYEQGHFAEAVAAYHQIIRSGNVSPAICFNLGNAHFKAGQPGLALVAYRQAEQLAPRDPDLRANVAFVRDQVEGPSYRMSHVETVFRALTLNEWAAGASIVFWIWILLLSARQLWPKLRAPLRGMSWLCGIATIILAGCLAAALTINSTTRAVVTSNEIPVRNGPFEESPDAFVVHDGAELRVLDRKGGWLQATVGSRTGWIFQTNVVVLQPPA